MALFDGNSTDELFIGDSEDDIAVGYGGNDNLYGYDGQDWLVGDTTSTTVSATGDDYLFGGSGNDTLNGGAGNDYLDGAFDNIADSNWLKERVNFDTLTGGAGSDTFVLGNTYGSLYYNTDIQIGYAHITDFDITQDYIQVSSAMGTYSLQTTSTGTGIFLNESDGTKDLFGFAEGVFDLDIGRDFIFV